MPGAGIIRNVGIIRGRALFEGGPYMRKYGKLSFSSEVTPWPGARSWIPSQKDIS